MKDSYHKNNSTLSAFILQTRREVDISALIRELESLKFLKAFRLSGRELEATIKDIQIEFDNAVYDIGDIYTKINLSSGDFYFDNLKHKALGRFDHPHINKGDACFGTIDASSFLDCFASGEFASGLDLLHSFLSQANSADEWGRHLVLFPVLKENSPGRGLDTLTVLEILGSNISDSFYDIKDEAFEDFEDATIADQINWCIGYISENEQNDD
jgi:hypothetical protein